MSRPTTPLEYRQTLCRNCICGADFTDPCAACAKGRWSRLADCQTAPSLMTMAVTASAALAAEAAAILKGEPAVSEAEIAGRLAICRECESFQASSERCSKCGCFLKFKTALRTGHCPIQKW